MKKSRFLNVWLFFAMVYLLSALLYLPILLSGTGRTTALNSALMALATFVPSVMGIVFIYLTKGPEERRDFWQRVSHWPHKRTKMAIAGLLVLPLLTITSFLVASFINGVQPSLVYAVEVLTNWKTMLVFLFVEITFGAISEELGWRGYALDELQSRWGALTSSLVLGLVWALWHSPAFLLPGMPQYEIGGVFSLTYVSFLISVTLGSILHTWVYNNTGRSILVAGILMHFAQNATMTFLGGIFERFNMPPAYWMVVLVMTGLAAALVVIVYGPKNLTRQPGGDQRNVQRLHSAA
jgi:membrane protease YdiL (CAAX protease family)